MRPTWEERHLFGALLLRVSGAPETVSGGRRGLHRHHASHRPRGKIHRRRRGCWVRNDRLRRSLGHGRRHLVHGCRRNLERVR